MKKKRPLTLLEVVVALFLTGILLSCLLTFFKDYSLVNIKMKAVKECTIARSSSHLRLSQVFTKALSGFYSADSEKSLNPALFFNFDNGVDYNPLFSNTVKASLYLNKKNTLMLEIQGGNGEVRQEALLENISAFSLNFFDGNIKNWVSHWPEDKERQPCMLTLAIVDKELKSSSNFSFLIPGALPVIYEVK